MVVNWARQGSTCWYVYRSGLEVGRAELIMRARRDMGQTGLGCNTCQHTQKPGLQAGLVGDNGDVLTRLQHLLVCVSTESVMDWAELSHNNHQLI